MHGMCFRKTIFKITKTIDDFYAQRVPVKYELL